MALILLMIIIASWLLALMGAMPFWSAQALTALSLAGLTGMVVAEQVRRYRIRKRCRRLGASIGLHVCNLGGLAIDAQAEATLFVTENDILIETDQVVCQYPHEQLNAILFARTNLVRKLSDAKISRFLGLGTVHGFSELREMLRRNELDSRLNILMILAVCDTAETAGILVLATSGITRAIARMFKKNPGLKDIVHLVGSDGKRSKLVL